MMPSNTGFEIIVSVGMSFVLSNLHIKPTDNIMMSFDLCSYPHLGLVVVVVYIKVTIDRSVPKKVTMVQLVYQIVSWYLAE